MTQVIRRCAFVQPIAVSGKLPVSERRIRRGANCSQSAAMQGKTGHFAAMKQVRCCNCLLINLCLPPTPRKNAAQPASVV